MCSLVGFEGNGFFTGHILSFVPGVKWKVGFRGKSRKTKGTPNGAICPVLGVVPFLGLAWNGKPNEIGGHFEACLFGDHVTGMSGPFLWAYPK